MTKCILKNGTEGSSDKAKNIIKIILELACTKQDKIKEANDILLLRELFNKAKNDKYRILDTQKNELIELNLLPKDGPIPQEEKNIILSSLVLDRETIFVQNPIDKENTIIELHGEGAYD